MFIVIVGYYDDMLRAYNENKATKIRFQRPDNEKINPTKMFRYTVADYCVIQTCIIIVGE